MPAKTGFPPAIDGATGTVVVKIEYVDDKELVKTTETVSSIVAVPVFAVTFTGNVIVRVDNTPWEFVETIAIVSLWVYPAGGAACLCSLECL